MHVGNWPKELFDLIDISSDIVGVTGAVHASSSGISPPMGNSHLPTEDHIESAHVKEVEIIDSNFNFVGIHEYKLEKFLDNDKCYGLKDGKKSVLFKFGGPRGNSCGI